MLDWKWLNSWSIRKHFFGILFSPSARSFSHQPNNCLNILTRKWVLLPANRTKESGVLYCKWRVRFKSYIWTFSISFRYSRYKISEFCRSILVTSESKRWQLASQDWDLQVNRILETNGIVKVLFEIKWSEDGDGRDEWRSLIVEVGYCYTINF